MFNITFLNQDNFQTTFNPSNSQSFNAELNVSYTPDAGLPAGGLKGSILTKMSAQDYDADWVMPLDTVTPDSMSPVMSSAVYRAILEAIASIMITCAPVYYDTEENWNNQTSLVAERRAVYVYSNHVYLNDGHGNQYPVPAIKIGDGTSYLIDMPFVNQDVAIQLATHINNTIIHVTGQDKENWNNKVSCFIDDNNSELLVFSKTQYKLEE